MAGLFQSRLQSRLPSVNVPLVGVPLGHISYDSGFLRHTPLGSTARKSTFHVALHVASHYISFSILHVELMLLTWHDYLHNFSFFILIWIIPLDFFTSMHCYTASIEHSDQSITIDSFLTLLFVLYSF